MDQHHLLRIVGWVRSDQISHSVVSESLRPHESQHARPPCPSPTPRVLWDSHPSSQWCHPSHLILCHPLLLLPPIPPSIWVFSNESTLRMRYWSFSFSIIPSKEIPGLISFRMDLLDILAVQGTQPSLFQGIFLAQGSNPGLLHGRQILHCLSPQRSPKTNF